MIPANTVTEALAFYGNSEKNIRLRADKIRERLGTFYVLLEYAVVEKSAGKEQYTTVPCLKKVTAYKTEIEVLEAFAEAIK